MAKYREREFWRKSAYDAERILGYRNKTMPLRQKRRIEIFIKAVDIREGRKVLEIGCGTGNFTQGLAESKAHIVAIDLSPELLNLAKAKRFPNVEYRVADIENLPFRNDSFAAVVGNSILHHCNLSPALNEIKRVLKNKGRVIFSEPNMLNPHVFFQKNIGIFKKLAGDSPGETAFFRWNLKNSFVSAGFSDIIIMPFDFLHPATPASFINVVHRLGLILERLPLLKEMAGSLIISAMVDKNG